MKLLLFKIFIVSIFVLEHTLYAQSPLRLSFNHLTREDGLSNNNILHIFTDSRGFTWLSSLNGLNRFDGINVNVYKPYNSGIKGIKIKTIVEDKNSNLWVGSEESLNFYDRRTDSFSPIPSPENDSFYTSLPIAIDKNNVLWVVISTKNGISLYTLNLDSRKFTLVKKGFSESFATFLNGSPKEIETLYFGIPNENGIHKLSIKNYKIVNQEILFDGNKNLPKLLNIKEFMFVEDDSTVWITGNPSGLIKFNSKRNTYKLYSSQFLSKGQGLNQVVSYRNFLLIGAVNGILVFDKTKEQWLEPFQFSASNPRGISSNWNSVLYLDPNKNLFLSQLGSGIDFTNLNHTIAENWFTFNDAQKLGFTDNHFSSIRKLGDKVCGKLQNNGVLIFDKNGKILKHYENKTIVLTDTQNQVLLTDGKQFYVENIDKNTSKTYQNTELSGKMGWQIDGTEIEPNLYLISSDKGLHFLNTQTNSWKPIEVFNKEKNVANSPVFYDKNSKQILVSSNWWSKLYVLEKKQDNWQIRTIKDWTVYAIRESIQANKVWLGTNSGLLLFDTKTLNYQQLTEKDGLPDNAVTDILEEPNGNYWLVTNQGISYYNKSLKEFRSYSSKDGITSKEIDWGYSFKLDDGRVVFGGTDGISVIGKTSSNIPKVQITKISVNEKPFKTPLHIGEATKIELEPNQSSFSIEMAGIEYGSPQRIKIKYQLQGYDNQWITSKNSATARYSNVREGTYQFLVQATDEDGKIGSEIKKLTIIVHAPFYRTAPFLIILILGLLALAYLIYLARIKQIREEAKKKEEIRRLRAEAEINALRSQMNPHFIFNCLNTIDSYILLNKTDDASEFLNKFSKLIRKILENSREEFNTIQKEIDTIELYIKLEQERSYPKFSYEISIDEQLGSEEYYIPTMLLQPFIENAILHGLRHKKDVQCELYFNIKKVSDQIVIHIIDNGIGREASKKINSLKSIGRKSVGIYVTQERIEKLNELYPQKAHLKITDINENDDKGTIVEIKLPLITLKDLQT